MDNQLWWVLQYSNPHDGSFVRVLITQAPSLASALAWAYIENNIVADSILTILPFRATHVDQSYADRLLTYQEALNMPAPNDWRPALDAPRWCDVD